MEIQTNTASLSTMAVTIQALHVNDKQMTLAVFRQLPKQSLGVALNNAFQVWGIVRYTIGDADLWVVASGGGVLWRCPASQNFILKRLQAAERGLFGDRSDEVEREEKMALDYILRGEVNVLSQLFIAV